MSSDENKHTTEKKWGVGHKIGLAVLIILAVLAIAILVVYRSLVVKPQLPPVDHKPPITTPAITIDPSTGETVPVETPTDEPPAPEVTQPVLPEKVSGERKSKDFYTILVVGTDVTSWSTDTMMLVSYDVTNQRATVMSIPRDTLVSAFGTEKSTRLNTIYSAYGGGQRGMNALTSEVSELVGFVPDYRVFIGWELVGQMVEAIGGVNYDVPFHMEYDDPAQDLHIYIEKGQQKLNGAQAMQLVRWRKNNAGVQGGGDGSDLTRLRVQQGFLKEVLRQTLQIQNVTRINELAMLFSEHVESDLSFENLLWFATQAIFNGLKVDSVEFTTMPLLAHYPNVYPNQEKLLELINTKLSPFQMEVTVYQLDLIYFDQDGVMCSTGRNSQ